MSRTAFTDLFSYVKVFLPGYDDTSALDTTINNAMKLVVMELPDYSEEIESGLSYITPAVEVGSNDYKLIIYRTALMILIPKNSFSYKTNILSVTRSSQGDSRNISYLQGQVDLIENKKGNAPLAIDGSIEAWLDAADRLEDVIDV